MTLCSCRAWSLQRKDENGHGRDTAGLLLPCMGAGGSPASRWRTGRTGKLLLGFSAQLGSEASLSRSDLGVQTWPCNL